MRLDLPVAEPEELSRDELIVVVRRQAGQISELMQANETLAGRLAKLEHLLSRNSGNSSSPPSRDGDPGSRPRRRNGAAGVGRSGNGASSPGRRERIWRGLMIPMNSWTDSPRAAATAAMTWAVPGTSVGSWTAISSTRSRRSP